MGDPTRVDASKVVVTFEQAELDAYMEAVHANGEKPTDDARVAYYLDRYEAIKETYMSLLLQKEEAEGRKSGDAMNALTPAFRANFVARRFVVGQLRKLGREVEDPYVPKADAARR